jgi:adenosylcobalamin-dependent ribonucleoside-triphosphate reductase
MKDNMFLNTISTEKKIRTFSLSNNFLDSYVDTQPKWGPVGYFTYKRTYARALENGDTEEFWQTCKRVVEGVYNVQKQHCKSISLPWDDRKAQLSAQEMFKRMWEFKFLPPGRGLWSMGTSIIAEKGGAALNNCGFVTTANIDIDFADPFCFLMDMSMLGVGVGSDTKGAGKVNIIPPKVGGTFVVEDSREGWCALLRVVLDAHIGKGILPRIIDYSKVRPLGAIIKGFGGIASGPGPLVKMIDSICKVLEVQAPTPITSSMIVDIHNLVGACVVAGGVRRTAEIMFGDWKDENFRNLKDPTDLNNWSSELYSLTSSEDTFEGKEERIEELKHLIENHPLRTHRWASNNSIFGQIGMDYTKVAESLAKNGEPGIIWLAAMKDYSRMNDPKDEKDYRAAGCNPCAEQTLEDRELCCLVETFPANHSSAEDYLTTLKYAYLYAKTVTLIPTHDERTNRTMMRNRRIGCSQTGIQQAIIKFGRRTFLNDFCDAGYKRIQNLDLSYSEWLAVPRSIKTTSVKPSGTVSLLCGASAGIHHPHSEYYIRNITVQETSPLVQACIDAGYQVEKYVYAGNTMVVSFPVKEENFSASKKDVSIWQQFKDAADLQAYWADNQVSVTVTFKKEEESQIKLCLESFEDKLKSISLLPLVEHGYVQAPYIEITKEQYEAMIQNIKPLILNFNTHEKDDNYCDGGACEIKL